MAESISTETEEEPSSIEDMIRRALINPAGAELMEELMKRYVMGVSFSDTSGATFADVAFREGQRSIVVMFNQIIGEVTSD